MYRVQLDKRRKKKKTKPFCVSVKWMEDEKKFHFMYAHSLNVTIPYNNAHF